MHEKNIALLCDEADRLLQLNINLLRQMVEEPDVLSDSKNENRLLFDKQKALKRIEELEGEQIKTARREMVLAVVGTMKAGKSTTINAIVGQEILPNRNRPMTSVPTLIRHVPGKTEPVLHLEHIQPVRNLLITLQEKLATPAGQQVAQTLQQTGDTRELLDILTDDGWLKNEYHGEEEIFTGLASLNDLVRLAAAMGTEFPFDEYAEVQKLPVIDVEFSHLVGMDACQGTLTLLDTPGPNEAGQPQMEVMMRDQLQKASAVLAVMDYTQMNSKADEDVRKELNAIADVSAGRLFVLVNKFDEKDRNGDGADAVRQKVPAMLNSDVLPASRVYPGSSRQAYLANRALHELRKNGTLPVDEAWVDDFVREAFGRMKKDYVCKDSELATEGATDLWECSLIDQLITEVILSSHSRAAALAVDSAAAKLMQNAENISEYLSLRHQGLMQSIQSLQAHITSLLEDIREIADCQEQVTADVRMAMEEIDARTRELLTGVCTSLEEELNDYFRSGKRKEQQMLEEENSAQPRERNAFAFFHDIFGTGNQHDRMRDFDPDSPEIKFSDRREALELMTQIESTVTSLHREAEAQFRPELEKIVSGIETGFRGTALYATENIAGRINTRLEDEGFTVKISFPAVSQLQTRLAVKTNLSALMEERTETVTRRRRQSGLWGKICGAFGTSDWGWETYKEDVSRSVININTVRKEVMSLTRAYFGELQASIEQDINQPVRQEIDAFFCAFREKVEQLRNTLIQSSEDHKRDQQAQERLT
ncbi:dynamin family protein, partial [Escherichia coli]|nr:dGTPase [Escherichia coli]EFH7005388.1 dGTPase [Escherichia coli]EHB8525885.1 dGTPase [Escherichia coli]EHC2109585.1 dGTPase [Escherichia coli]EHC2512993.1 dGTPase [Escherichia coli]